MDLALNNLQRLICDKTQLTSSSGVLGSVKCPFIAITLCSCAKLSLKPVIIMVWLATQSKLVFSIAQSAGVVEYTDCISAEK